MNQGITVSATCRRCATRYERPWPGDRPAICPQCPVTIGLLWRFVNHDDLPVLPHDARELKEWFTR